MELVIGQQLHAAGEIFLQNLERELKSGALVGGNVIKRLLEGKAIEGGGSVGVEGVQNVAHAFLILRSLQIAVMFQLAQNRDRGAGGVGADDQADAVGELGVGNGQ